MMFLESLDVVSGLKLSDYSFAESCNYCIKFNVHGHVFNYNVTQYKYLNINGIAMQLINFNLTVM